MGVAAGVTAYTLSQKKEEKDFSGAPLKRKIQRFNSLVDRGQDPGSLKDRAAQLKALKSGELFDVVVVGAGCTGAGAALDATTRGLKTACIERGDFANETSSRSSKLIWGGFKYLQVAFAELLNRETIYKPGKALKAFYGEFMMVYECCQVVPPPCRPTRGSHIHDLLGHAHPALPHPAWPPRPLLHPASTPGHALRTRMHHRPLPVPQERSWLAGQQPHLVQYVPQAVPFQGLYQWPPYFNHPFYAILPVLAVPAFLFYDALASWCAPTSYAMSGRKTKEVFPHLKDALYSAVYCEAMHNDARTGTAIALTAALKGATIANYVEMVGVINDGPEGATATGIECVDKLTGEKFVIKASAIVLATGPFLDSARKLDDPGAPKSVAAASGCHLVLPGYFTPGNMGFAELRTSRGATMYFLPWLGHTIVGSTDKKCDAKSSPHVSEDEIQYLVNEAATCLSSDIRVRRSDVLSAWQGWRPLYKDPNAPPGAPVSRHHAIGHDEKSGITFICGGKWSTYRAMAEELIDKVIEHRRAWLKHAGPCVTREIKLLGGEGFHELLYVQLVQKYGVSEQVAKHLVHTYGAVAFAVLELAKPAEASAKAKGIVPAMGGTVGRLIAPNYPYLECEVEYACKHEYAVTVKDMLTTRMRLAFLNSEAAKGAIPRVAELMASHLKWSKAEKERQIKTANEYIGDFGGPVADKSQANLRSATFTDLHEIFLSIDIDGSGHIDEKELEAAAKKLGFPFKTKADLHAKFMEIDADGNGRISESEFIEWWNGRNSRDFEKKLRAQISLTATSEVALEKLMFGASTNVREGPLGRHAPADALRVSPAMTHTHPTIPASHDTHAPPCPTHHSASHDTRPVTPANWANRVSPRIGRMQRRSE